MSEFSDFILGVRIKKSWSQAKLAKEAGVTAGYINQIEIGGQLPRLPKLAALARALDTSIHDLKVLWTIAKIPPEALQDVVAKVFKKRQVNWVVSDSGASYGPNVKELIEVASGLPQAEIDELTGLAKIKAARYK